MTGPDTETPATELEEVELSKETIEDLDAPEDASEDAVGGSAGRTVPATGNC
jgi:hypothetical protein